MMTNVDREIDSVMVMQRGSQPITTHRDNRDLVNRDEHDSASSQQPPDSAQTLTDPDENWLVDKNAQPMLTSTGQTERGSQREGKGPKIPAREPYASAEEVPRCSPFLPAHSKILAALQREYGAEALADGACHPEAPGAAFAEGADAVLQRANVSALQTLRSRLAVAEQQQHDGSHAEAQPTSKSIDDRQPNFLAALFAILDDNEEFIANPEQTSKVQDLINKFYSIRSDEELDQGNRVLQILHSAYETRQRANK